MSTEPEIQAAAVVFRHDEHDRQVLADFARELADSGCRLGGVVQEVFFDDQGRRTHIDSVDLADDILDVIAEGLPILVLVLGPALTCWRELTGGEIAEVPCEADELRRWWRDRSAGKS